MKPAEPVAIAGIGSLSAAGLSLDAQLAALFEGKRSPAPPVRFGVDAQYGFPVFEITEDFFPSAAFKRQHPMRTCQLALTATQDAMNDARVTADQLSDLRVGVCIGTNVGSSMNNEAFYRDNIEGCDPYLPPLQRFLTSNPTISISREYGTSGPSQTVVNACSAGSDALGLAAGWIRSGVCDVVISGGADELYQVTCAGFKALMIYDTSPCKPFDAHRRGLNLGEGAAIFLLMSPSTVAQLGLSPRGYLFGYGSAADAYHFTKPRPDGLGLKMALIQAMDAAGIGPEQVAFINAHGTGTKDNDLIESTVLNELFPTVPFLSSKGITGHTLGASGAIEAAFSLACLEKGMVPASVGYDTADSELPARPLSQKQPITSRVAISQTLAFGGNNAAIIVGTQSSTSSSSQRYRDRKTTS